MSAAAEKLSSIDFADTAALLASPAAPIASKESEPTRPAVTDRVAPAPPKAEEEPRSEAQQIYDRYLAQCNRFNDLRKELEEVVRWIAPKRAVKVVSPPDAPSTTMPTSFFDGLHVLADANDQVADEMKRTLDNLRALF